MSHKPIDEKTDQLLKAVSDHFDMEDRAVRERQIRMWRRLKLYWNGFQNIWYSEVAHDWRIWNNQIQADENDQSFYDKPVNVFRAYLESLIAALSVTIPAIKCYPDDADNPNDIDTAKAGDKIAQLVAKHNDVSLLWLHALYIYCTEGMIAAYSYPKEDEKFGTYDENKYEDVVEEKYICVNCQAQLADEMFSQAERDEFMPSDAEAPLQYALRQGNVCPECGIMLDPDLQKSQLIVQRLVGITKHPKTRQCIEVYGGLYVKIPNYAMKQADIPYLRFSYETHYSNVTEKYPEFRNKFDKDSKAAPSAQGVYDPYEAWGRLSPQYNGEYPINTCTVNNYWFRPSAFNVLDQEDAEFLKKKFPNGCKYVKINEFGATAENESLDDCWTIAHNPLSDYLHYDPLGMLLTSVQDITNDLVSLTLQTIEHGIPQTFADPTVLNFDTYRQTETTPGAIYPATPRAGKAVGEGFYEVKTATLSAEILPFGQNIQQLGQLASGALPSLFGGGAEGSKTASEYSMSRAQALQRLQTPWKMLTLWWKSIFGKVIPAYIKDVVEDERVVQRDNLGNFINVFIRKAELQGKIGQVELEANEQLPIAWAQKRDVVMQLMQLNNPEILEALTSIENLPFVKSAIGLDDFTLPGEADRQKQYEEIQQLVNSEPIVMPGQPIMGPMGPMEGPPQELPSVEVDPLLDNHQIEAEICRQWLIGDAGRLAKVENPAGYKNVLLHLKMHMMIQMQNMMQQQQPMQAGGAPVAQDTSQANMKAPIREENDAQRYIQ